MQGIKNTLSALLASLKPKSDQLEIETYIIVFAVAVIRYLNGAKRALIALVENLWDKYAVSSRELEAERSQTLTELNDFLVKLGYLN
ncbi:MAG: hypothetical protein U1V55_01690 [Planktothrix rubescens PR222]|jgi:hypothetical protein